MQVFKPVRDRNAKYYTNLARQMLNPGMISKAIVAPNTAPAQVCARHFSRTVEVSQASYPDLRVVMLPNLLMPGFIGGGASFLVPPAGGGPMTIAGKFHTDGTDNTNNCGNMIGEVSYGGSNPAIINGAPIADNAAVQRYAMQISPQSASFCALSFTNESNTKDATPVVTLYGKVAGGAWVVLSPGTSVVPVAQNKSVYTSLQFAAVDYQYLAFSVTGTSGKQCSFSFSISLNSAQATGGQNLSFAPAFGSQILDLNITTGRVTAMSLLCTNTGSALVTAGTVNTGRVPSTFNVTTPYAAQLQTLPPNRQFIGPLVEGSYTTWMPSQLDEIEVDNIASLQRAYHDAEFIVLEIPDWVAGCTVKLRFDWVVEFFTPSQAYEKILTPPRSAQWEALFYALLQHPAAMCNPTHETDTNSMLDRIRQTFLSVGKFAIEHQELLSTIGHALMAIAAA